MPSGGGGASKIVAETADVVTIDRTKPMSASGFAGSTAERSRYGAFEARVRLADGSEVDVVVKIIPTRRQGKDAGGFFAKEVEGARAAAQTGLGPISTASSTSTTVRLRDGEGPGSVPRELRTARRPRVRPGRS
jgi:hypothetical protein